MPEPSLLQRLKERKLVQWAIAYLCGAWVFVEVTNLVVDQFSWPQTVGQAVTLLAFFGFFVVLVLSLSIAFTVRLRRAVLKPLELLSRAARRFGSGAFYSRVGDIGEGEFRALSQAFDHMAEELELNRRRRHRL